MIPPLVFFLDEIIVDFPFVAQTEGVMPREGGAPSNRKRRFWIETAVVTGSSAFADDDSGESPPGDVAKKH
jgi:hypothetical protein